MRRVIWSALAILATLVMLAPAPVQAQSKEEREVRALLDRFFQAANTTDEKTALRLLADHSRAGGPYYPPFADVLKSTAEVEALSKQHQGQIIARSYQPVGTVLVKADRAYAWAAYQWRADFTFKDGTRHSYTGRASAGFVREGKVWKFTHWHSSVAAPAPLTAAVRDAESQKIIEIERNAWEAIKNKQPDALADYFAEDASIFMESSAYRMSGRANLLRGLASSMERSELRSYQMLEPQVQLAGDTAVLTYYFTESGISPSGREYSTAGKSTLVFVKQGSTWRALHEHRSVNR